MSSARRHLKGAAVEAGMHSQIPLVVAFLVCLLATRGLATQIDPACLSASERIYLRFTQDFAAAGISESGWEQLYTEFPTARHVGKTDGETEMTVFTTDLQLSPAEIEKMQNSRRKYLQKHGGARNAKLAEFALADLSAREKLTNGTMNDVIAEYRRFSAAHGADAQPSTELSDRMALAEERLSDTALKVISVLHAPTLSSQFTFNQRRDLSMKLDRLTEKGLELTGVSHR